MLALQQVHLGIEVAIECALNGGGHGAVERGVLHVPRAHLQADVVAGLQVVEPGLREVDVEGPPSGVGGDESVVAHIVGPGGDVGHESAVARLPDGDLVHDGLVLGYAVGPGGLLGQVVGHGHLPHVVVAGGELAGHVEEEAQRAGVLVIDGEEIVVHGIARAASVEHPFPSVAGGDVVAESVGQVGLHVAIVPS